MMQISALLLLLQITANYSLKWYGPLEHFDARDIFQWFIDHFYCSRIFCLFGYLLVDNKTTNLSLRRIK